MAFPSPRTIGGDGGELPDAQHGWEPRVGFNAMLTLLFFERVFIFMTHDDREGGRARECSSPKKKKQPKIMGMMKK